MTTLGRLIFFDQPGTGAFDPVTADEMPNMEQWPAASPTCLNTSGLAKRSSSRSTGPSRLRRCSQRHILHVRQHWSALECYADPLAEPSEACKLRKAHMERLAGTPHGEAPHAATIRRTGGAGGAADNPRANGRPSTHGRSVHPCAGQVHRRSHIGREVRCYRGAPIPHRRTMAHVVPGDRRVPHRPPGRRRR